MEAKGKEKDKEEGPKEKQKIVEWFCKTDIWFLFYCKILFIFI